MKNKRNNKFNINNKLNNYRKNNNKLSINTNKYKKTPNY